MVYSNMGPTIWDKYRVDMVNTPAGEFSFLVQHPGSQVGLPVDLKNSATLRNTYLILLVTSTDGHATTANAFDNTVSQAIGHVCKKSGASGADVWSLVSKFMAFSKSGLNYVNSRGAVASKAAFIFSPTEITLGSNKIKSSAARTSEILLVSDAAPVIGLTYVLQDTTGQQITTVRKADRSLVSIAWMFADGSILSCRF